MEKLTHLGSVKRVYMEADGNFAIITSDEKKSGLSILPDWDTDFQARRQAPATLEICHNCGTKKEGNVITKKGQDRCRNCGANAWTKAVDDLR
jgi:DNA-directed RNA polymerase subunit RPC12/RpoP